LRFHAIPTRAIREQGEQGWMCWGKDYGGGAEDGVYSRSKNFNVQIAGAFHRETNAGAARFPDPIALHGENALGPTAGEFGHVVE
jgi:hypothetical protein